MSEAVLRHEIGPAATVQEDRVRLADGGCPAQPLPAAAGCGQRVRRRRRFPGRRRGVSGPFHPPGRPAAGTPRARHRLRHWPHGRAAHPVSGCGEGTLQRLRSGRGRHRLVPAFHHPGLSQLYVPAARHRAQALQPPGQDQRRGAETPLRRTAVRFRDHDVRRHASAARRGSRLLERGRQAAQAGRALVHDRLRRRRHRCGERIRQARSQACLRPRGRRTLLVRPRPAAACGRRLRRRLPGPGPGKGRACGRTQIPRPLARPGRGSLPGPLCRRIRGAQR